jgi:hypothetical protein
VVEVVHCQVRHAAAGMEAREALACVLVRLDGARARRDGEVT